MKSLYFITTLFGLILLAYVFYVPSDKSQIPNKETIYYDKENPTPNVVISEQLSVPNTLEEVIVNNMIVVKNEDVYPIQSPQFHPIIPSAAGAALVE
jgi:hypothetical protein